MNSNICAFDTTCQGITVIDCRLRPCFKPGGKAPETPNPISSTVFAGYATKLAEAENRLLNAFQLVKNGKHIGYLKFDEFLLMLDKKHDCEGNIVA